MVAQISASEEFVAAERVLLYAAVSDELPVWTLAAAAHAAHKLLLWPRVNALRVVEVARARVDELEPDAAGVLAPPPASEALMLGRGDLLIVPGVAFGRDGARLGRGGGHYDRLLARSSGYISIGVAFDIQLVDELPAEPHDRRADIVVTPNGFWRAAR